MAISFSGISFGGGGGGDNYFSAALTGTASRAHSITGVSSTVTETYQDGTVIGLVQKSAASMGLLSSDGGVTARMVLAGGASELARLGIASGIGDTEVLVDESGIYMNMPDAGQRFAIRTGLGGLPGLESFDDDAAAGVGGLDAGDLFQTTGSGAAPLNAAGIVMIKQ